MTGAVAGGPSGVFGPNHGVLGTPHGPGEADDVEEISFPALATREPQAAMPLPIQNPPLLPFRALEPEVFERVVAEIVFRHRDHIGTHFYGRRGQRQYGLDIVELLRSGQTVLYQVKRYQTVDSAQLRSAVEDYAGAPRLPDHGLAARRFDPHRFVVVTSAELERDTANVDEIDNLHTDYLGDLEIEVWGAEALSRMMRDTPGLVRAVFGPAWTLAFCGYLPVEPDATDPRSLGLVEEPARVLGLESSVADAESREADDPSEAAALFGSIAEQLERSGFPGHAALMRTRQASAERAAGNAEETFRILFQVALDRVGRGDDLRAASGDLQAISEELGGVARMKWRTLEAIAVWHEQGTNLEVVRDLVPALAASGDSDAAELCCLILEQAMVDGLFDFDPPRSVIVDTDEHTAAALSAAVDAAADLPAPDPVIRTRLRCLVADSRLRVDSTPAEVEAAYGTTIDDAVAGRLLAAGGLATSRAAFALATHGAIDRAETLWRQSVLVSSEQGLYGDARSGLRSIQTARIDHGQWMTGITTILEAMPNRRRLLETRHQVSLVAFEAAQEQRLPDAFGDSRRWLCDARISGQLVDERLAWKLLGRVLLASRHAGAAIECLVRAGEGKEAATVASVLAEPADTWRWINSPVRAVRAAAIKVRGAQLAMVEDHDLPQLADELLGLAQPLWGSPFMNPSPELDAVKVLSSLGRRIPETAVSGILDLAQPALEAPTRGGSEVGNLLVQTYWAVPEARIALAGAIGALLEQPDPPHDLWDLVENIPNEAHEHLLPILSGLAESGNRAAQAALLAWRHDPRAAQVVARRACASLLRRPIGHERESHALSTEEGKVAALIQNLLEAEQEFSVPCEELVPAACPPVGGTLMAVSVVAEPGQSPAPDTAEIAQIPDPTALDAAARAASESREQLVVTMTERFLALAEDHHDIAGSRANSVAALLHILPHVPGDTAWEAAGRLIAIQDEPHLTRLDTWELEHDTPLSRMHVGAGAKTFPWVALVGGARAFLRAHEDHAALVGAPELSSRIVAAAQGLLVLTDAEAPGYGARAIAAVAQATPELAHNATALLFHPDESVRAFGAVSAPMDAHLFGRLARDPSAKVRRATATRGKELPAAVIETLKADVDVQVRGLLNQARNEEGH